MRRSTEPPSLLFLGLSLAHAATPLGAQARAQPWQVSSHVLPFASRSFLRLMLLPPRPPRCGAALFRCCSAAPILRGGAASPVASLLCWHGSWPPRSRRKRHCRRSWVSLMDLQALLVWHGGCCVDSPPSKENEISVFVLQFFIRFSRTRERNEGGFPWVSLRCSSE